MSAITPATMFMISAGISATGSLMQLNAQRAATAEMTRRYEQEAKVAEFEGLQAELQRRREVEQILANNRAVQGASGVGDSRSFFAIQQDVRNVLDQDLQNIAFNTNKIISNLFRISLKKCGVDQNYVQFIYKKDRKIVDKLLSKMKGYIDLIVPRGGKSLVKKVDELSTVPYIGHLEGICHTFIDKKAQLKMAIKVLENAKMRNTSICGATETVLFHKGIAKKFTNPVLKNLQKKGCNIFADKTIKKLFDGKSNLANKKNWSTEYLSSNISAKVVKNLDEAVRHINQFGTMHTDAIITNDKKAADYFLKGIKSSIGIHNSSTQFADGGEFGFGAEVGISTNNLPPRGPVGLGQLVSYKYEVYGKGQIRK
mgnify:CR=1 FL=1